MNEMNETSEFIEKESEKKNGFSCLLIIRLMRYKN